jgi:hypothetical protein
MSPSRRGKTLKKPRDTQKNGGTRADTRMHVLDRRRVYGQELV